MKISGFTIIRNGEKFCYPYKESIQSLLPLVDEMIINVGKGDDQTLDEILKIKKSNPKKEFTIIESEWKMDDPEKRKSGVILSEQTNIALSQCKYDWCFYLQADEVLHEKDLHKIKSTMKYANSFSKIDGLVFDYVHFYGNYEVCQKSRSAYRREVRAFKNNRNVKSIGDAQSFKKEGNSKLSVVLANARIFHYGWVRPPEAMKNKTAFMDTLYHDSTLDQPATGNNYQYKRFWGLKYYKDDHPKIMSLLIQKKGWEWDLSSSPFVFHIKDIKKIALDLFEKITKIRLFEYRCYRLIANHQLRSHKPHASLFVSTYEMPDHLSLVCEALLRQSYRSFEVIFCDDGSGKTTNDIVFAFKKNASFDVKHIWQVNKGFRKCKILNEGLRQSTGDILIFLDGDCVPHKDFIKDHVKQNQIGYYLAGRRVELGPKFSNTLTSKSIQKGIFDYPHLSFIKSILSKDSEYFQRSIRFPFYFLRKILGMLKIDDLKGCNYSVHREALLAINGFDETYEGYGREDTDVEIRLKHLGLKIKSLKGLALQFHVWHPRREFTPQNDDKLNSVTQKGDFWCESGVNIAH